MVFLYILGYRIDATRLLVSEVMLPRGLVGLGIDTMDYSGTEVAEALMLYTTARTTPALVHCTQGKDRTGMDMTCFAFIGWLGTVSLTLCG